MNAIEKFRKRREKRLKERYDEEDTGWRTTKDKKKIHINESGVCDIGNQYVRAGMGRPENVEIPKKVETKTAKPYNENEKTTESLYKALKNRKEKDCIFGGFFKVKNEQGYSSKRSTFFNPYTGEEFTEVVVDYEYDTVNTYFKSELDSIPLNEDVLKTYNRSHGIITEGDSVVVAKGRTIPKGTKAKVRKIYPYKDKYGRTVADYAYLDNGQKINIANLILDDD